jgi:hypothetical protein
MHVKGWFSFLWGEILQGGVKIDLINPPHSKITYFYWLK